MRVVIAGGHGQIALLLARALADAGHRPVGLIRSPEHADAVVLAAGAGPGSNVARKLTVDRAAAIKIAQAATLAAVRRDVVVSAVGAARSPAPTSPPSWRPASRRRPRSAASSR